MDQTERTFRHSFGKLALMVLGGLFFAYIVFSMGELDYFMLAMTGIIFVVAISYATSSVKISGSEITASRFFISKSLRWSDIARVSMRGQSLRLHNRDEDITMSLDSQLDGYTEILDIIFNKRPELFDTAENNVLSRSMLGLILTIGFGLLIMAFPAFIFWASDEFDLLYGTIFFVIGIVMMAGWLFAPQSVALENETMLVSYLYKKVSYSINDINSITLEKQRTRNGYIYFVQLNLKSGKPLKLPGFKQGNALTYQLLKRWHSKSVSDPTCRPT